jgi:hypothetical protein
MMKKTQKLLGIVLFTALFSVGCKDKVTQERTFMANVPVYMSQESFENAIQSNAAKELVNPGKIYFKDQYLFINDILNGIHVIDNSNPYAPINLSYINIPGNRDLVIKGSTLYADSYTDLVSIDISDVTAVRLLNREKDIFMPSFPLMDNDYPVYGLKDTNAVVVAWATQQIKEYKELNSNYNYGRECIDCYFAIDNFSDPNNNIMFETTSGSGDVSNGRNASGIAGSMSRFACYNDYLYVLDDWTLQSIDISGNSLNVQNEIELWRTAETLFPYNGNLFIGTTTGMMIYDLSNPSTPNEISTFEHMTSCDPVVVKGDYAYVTLRSGNTCWGFTDQLDIVNISDIYNPYLVKSYPMSNPHGLGVDNNTLFLCDGDAGLKVFDILDPNNVDQNLLHHFTNINGFDVIPSQGNLMLIGSDGLYQYNYEDLSEMVLRSKIPVRKF